MVALASRLTAGEDAEVVLDHQPPVGPYMGAAQSIRIVRATELGVSVSGISDQLVIVGDREGLAAFGENVHRLATTQTLGRHIHVDYFPGHGYLRADSAPTIVERK